MEENTTEIQAAEVTPDEVVVDKKKVMKAAAAKFGIQVGISVAVGLVSHIIVKAIESSLTPSDDEETVEGEILEEE